jgi:hypothetical protein
VTLTVTVTVRTILPNNTHHSFPVTRTTPAVHLNSEQRLVLHCTCLDTKLLVCICVRSPYILFALHACLCLHHAAHLSVSPSPNSVCMSTLQIFILHTHPKKCLFSYVYFSSLVKAFPCCQYALVMAFALLIRTNSHHAKISQLNHDNSHGHGYE